MAFDPFGTIATLIFGNKKSANPVEAVFGNVIGKVGSAATSAIFDKDTKQTPNRTRFNRQGPAQRSSIPRVEARSTGQPAQASNKSLDRLQAEYSLSRLSLKAGGIDVAEGAVKKVSTQRGLSYKT